MASSSRARIPDARQHPGCFLIDGDHSPAAGSLCGAATPAGIYGTQQWPARSAAPDDDDDDEDENDDDESSNAMALQPAAWGDIRKCRG
jgi:hypothetical protein